MSLSCSNLTLHQTAEDNQSDFDRVTKEAILKKNWYVDDLLKQEATTQLHPDCGDIPACVSWCVESFVIESGSIPGSLLPTRKHILSTNLEIQMCYIPSNFGEIISYTSQSDYGMVWYPYFENQTGQVHCNIIVRTDTVPFVKQLTVPGSVRKIHYSLHNLQVFRLDYDELQVVSCEVESIRNGIPILRLSDYPNFLDLIAPDNKQCPGPTCDIISKYDKYARLCCQQ